MADPNESQVFPVQDQEPTQITVIATLDADTVPLLAVAVALRDNEFSHLLKISRPTADGSITIEIRGKSMTIRERVRKKSTYYHIPIRLFT